MITNKKGFSPLSMLIVFGFVFIVFLISYEPIRFWNSDYERSLGWCKFHKPELNISIDKKISFCYNEGWKDYCKISYPQDCPNNNYTDLERCILKCKDYDISLEKCPCVEVKH